MYLLYIDESGNEDNPVDRHFVLGGVAVFERQTFFLQQSLDAVQTNHFPGTPPIPFHASAIRSGKEFWRKVSQATRESVLADIGKVIASSNPPGVVLFAAVIEKNDRVYGEEAVKRATEQMCQRFDVFLMRQYQEASNPQRGLLIFSEGRYDKRAKLWVRGFRELGTQWGTLKNLSDIPFFASMRDTRMLPVADFVAHSVFLLYERRDAGLVRQIIRRFDQKEGAIHGMVHFTNQKTRSVCACPACASKRSPGNMGSWL